MGATTYDHDADGNLSSSSEGFAATYNDAGQTTSMTPPGGGAIAMSYADVSQDERVSAGDRTFAYNLLGLTLESQAGSDTQYVRDNTGELISQRSSAGTEYFLFDALGSVVALIDEDRRRGGPLRLRPLRGAGLGERARRHPVALRRRALRRDHRADQVRNPLLQRRSRLLVTGGSGQGEHRESDDAELLPIRGQRSNQQQ